MTIPREEFAAEMNRLHTKMDIHKDQLQGKIEDLSRDVVELQTRFEMTPIPEIPSRPCPFFRKHEAEHEKIRFMVIKSIVGAVVGGIISAIATVLVFLHDKSD